MKIPWQSLSPEALNGLIEEFVTRDGTDYGEIEISLEARILEVQRQLQNEEAFIGYDEESGSCTVLLASGSPPL